MGQLKSALALKCPRCNQGELFESKNPYQPGKMMTMHTHCSNCGLRYEKEQGFFYGAMYVSYMLNIALFVTATVGWYLFIEDLIDWRIYIGIYVLLTVLLVPIIFRYSRSLWMIMMIKYEPEKRGER
ncbi:DUF983 domain-containing protein [Jiulongibacter sediminis]|uniref:DUF983 domain-containing protein n=1 Tax=Jiulongibacter sediminis TaxID=1605367 RepID=A0A0P7BCQ2_9BACT|nr:DUF983 domain-containing protein [Jiulongibacter sediminis]KPM48384.1 hypothetical protein AFM12_06990 [Jiulongibacter sediminis]TBX24922.1 hypothetical protein TK44_06995 [Jiulongibacter sediminis]